MKVVIDGKLYDEDKHDIYIRLDKADLEFCEEFLKKGIRPGHSATLHSLAADTSEEKRSEFFKTAMDLIYKKYGLYNAAKGVLSGPIEKEKDNG